MVMTTPVSQTAPPTTGFHPPQINNLEDTGLSPLWLQDHVLKVL